MDAQATLLEFLGIRIRVHASWILVAALAVWTLASGYFPAKVPGLTRGDYLALSIAGILGLVFSLILHELAHMLAARRFGLGVGAITLFVFGGVAELDEEPFSPRSEFWVAVAGPGTSLALALLAWLGLASVADAVLSAPLQALLRYLMVVNLALALFNLLPAFPLDGGRVLRAALWQRSGDLVRATRLASGVGNAFAFALIAAGLVSLLTDAPFVAVWSILIGFFLLSSARTTWHQLKVRKALAGRSVQSLMTPTPRTVEPDLTLEQLVDSLILAECISFVPVCEHGRLLGHVDAQAVQRIDREFWGTSRVADVMTVADATTCIGTDLPVDTLIRRMMQGGRRKFLVADGQHLLGVITLSDVLAYLSVLYETGTLREIPPLDKRPGSP